MKLAGARRSIYGALLAIASSTIGCATTLKLTVPAKSEVLSQPDLGIEKIKYTILNIDQPDSARAMVENRHRYIKELFVNSVEPYFGSNRWSDSCIRRNQIGHIQKNKSDSSFRASVTVDSNLNAGFCTDDAQAGIYLVGQCIKSGLFYEITAVGKNLDRASFRCPNEIRVKE